MAADVQENWIKWVALTTTILAVCAAIGSLKGGGFSTQVQLMTTQETNKWSYFQSKSIKQHVSEMERDLLSIQLAQNTVQVAKDKILATIKTVDDNIARYDKEKADIKAEAEDLSKQQAALKKHGGNFGLAVMFFQIAIMLSAIASLLKQRSSWIIGLVVGGMGMVFFLNGFFLFF